MAFEIGLGVLPRKADGTSREPIYYRSPGQTAVFTCTVGRYMFTNGISATVFSYLLSKVGYAVAEASVIRMEQKLDAYGAKFSEVSVLDVVAKVVPIAKHLRTAEKALAKGGSVFIKGQVANDPGIAQFNPFEPTTAARWVGKGCDEYVEYALEFWAVHKMGPAYKLLGKEGKML
jgi:hypothetical protein